MGAEQNSAHGEPMPDHMDPHPFDGQFEPPAEAVSKENPCIPLPEITLASIAISLKRLADSVEQLGLANPKAPEIMVSFFRQLAYDMGRDAGKSFEVARCREQSVRSHD